MSKSSFFKLATVKRPTGSKAVHVEGKIRRGDVAKAVYLQLPQKTVDQLDKSMQGAMAPGIVGLIEWALDELNRQGVILTIANSGE